MGAYGPTIEAAQEWSDQFDDAVRREWQAMFDRVEEQRERAEQLRALADQLQGQADRDEARLKEFEDLLGVGSALRLESLDSNLRGRRLQEVAVELLEAEVGPDTPIHYREWYDRLRKRGHRVAGRNPLANFLAQVSRAPSVRSVGSRSGLYVLARDQ